MVAVTSGGGVRGRGRGGVRGRGGGRGRGRGGVRGRGRGGWRGRAVTAFHSRSTRSSPGRRVVVNDGGGGPSTVRRVNLGKSMSGGNEAVVPASTSRGSTCRDHSAGDFRGFADAAYERAVAVAKESLRSEYSVIQKVISEKVEARKSVTKARDKFTEARDKLTEARDKVTEAREELTEFREKITEEIEAYKQLLMNEKFKSLSAVQATVNESSKLLSNYLVPLISVESDSNTEEQLPKQSTSENNEPREVQPISVAEESSKLLSNNLVPLMSVESDSYAEEQLPKQSTSKTNEPRAHPTVNKQLNPNPLEHVQKLHKVQAIAAKKEPPKLLLNNLVPVIYIENDNSIEEQLPKQSSSKTKKPTTHPVVKTQKTRSFVSKMQELSLVTEDKPYYTSLWDFDSTNDDTIPKNQNSTLEVPSWRLKPFTLGYKLEGTEDMSDDFYNSRHEVLKVKEQKRKKWDLQQLREQKRIEHLKAGCNKKHRSQTKKEELTTLLPDPFNIKRIEVTNDVPISVFGVNLHVKKNAAPFKFYRSKWCHDGPQMPQKSQKTTLLGGNPLLDLYPPLT